jgi:SAM-dependent methyltransferase
MIPDKIKRLWGPKKIDKKHDSELNWWKKRLSEKGGIPYWRGLYVQLYCHYLDITPESFRDKIILDIGCGPHGAISCFKAKLKFAVDPLVHAYHRLFDLSGQDVVYLACGSEKIPLIDGAVDIVISRNALDHVDDVEETVNELFRVLRRGGQIILSINYQESPHICEPHVINEKILSRLLDGRFTYEIIKNFPKGYDSQIGGPGQFIYDHKIVLVKGIKS